VPATFATADDMAARFEARELIELTDDAGTGAIDADRLGQALASANAIVEGYVAATYVLDPGAPPALLLIDAACDIARFRLYRTTAPEDVATRNNQAIQRLQSIRSGTIKLDQGVEAIAPRGGKVLLQPGQRAMTRDDLAGF